MYSQGQSPKTSLSDPTPVAPLFTLLQPHQAEGLFHEHTRHALPQGLCTCCPSVEHFPSVLSGSWQVLNEHWSEWMNSLSCVTLASYLRSLFQ